MGPTESPWTVTWYGHATAAIEVGGRRVLVDPLGRARARAAASAGRIDAVLITHAHVDHLNRWTLRALSRDTHLVVPRGARPIVADLGFAKVTEAECGDQIDLGGGVAAFAVATCHDQGRWRKGDAPTCAGWVVRSATAAVHHAGDVDFADHAVFDELGKQHRLDATLLPIGGMLPVWYYRWRRTSSGGVHIDPDAALAIAERLGAAAMVPIHWGTVNLRLGPASMPKRRLVQVAAERGLERLVRVLGHGGTLSPTSGVLEDHAERGGERDQEPDDAADEAVAGDRVAEVELHDRP